MAKPIHKKLEQEGAKALPEGRVAPEAPTAEELSKRWRRNAGRLGMLAVVGAFALKALKFGVLFHFAAALGWGWGGLAVAGLVLAAIVIERLVASRRAHRAPSGPHDLWEGK